MVVMYQVTGALSKWQALVCAPSCPHKSCSPASTGCYPDRRQKSAAPCFWISSPGTQWVQLCRVHAFCTPVFRHRGIFTF